MIDHTRKTSIILLAILGCAYVIAGAFLVTYDSDANSFANVALLGFGLFVIFFLSLATRTGALVTKLECFCSLFIVGGMGIVWLLRNTLIRPLIAYGINPAIIILFALPLHIFIAKHVRHSRKP